MAHLTTGELVDLAEGTRDATAAPHLRTCERCRRQLSDLREMMAATASVDVPEPSPLFWDHLSARVREAAAGEPPRRRVPLFDLWWVRASAGIAVVALVVGVMATLTPHRSAPASSSRPPEPQTPVGLLGASDDPSLGLVADFGRTLDWDDVREQMAVSTHPGVLDAAVGELNGGERRELERLLREELARPAGRPDRS